MEHEETGVGSNIAVWRRFYCTVRRQLTRAIRISVSTYCSVALATNSEKIMWNCSGETQTIGRLWAARLEYRLKYLEDLELALQRLEMWAIDARAN